MNTNSASPRHRCVADALGLGTLADGEPGMDPGLLRQLYQHARNDDGLRQLFEGDTTFVRGWVNLDSQEARSLIDAFVPLDDADSLKEARRTAQANLEAQAWNDILHIDAPPILCKVKVHGAKWGLRFQSTEKTLRGQERLNEQLPPIGVRPVENAGVSAALPPAISAEAHAGPANPPCRSADEVAGQILQDAGFPA